LQEYWDEEMQIFHKELKKSKNVKQKALLAMWEYYDPGLARDLLKVYLQRCRMYNALVFM